MKHDAEKEEAQLFKIWISDSSHQQALNWGGRDLTFSECVRELEILYKEYETGELNPWCEGEPYNPNVYCHFQVVCCNNSGSSYNFGIRDNMAFCHPEFFFSGPIPAFEKLELIGLSDKLTEASARTKPWEAIWPGETT